ncbi:MAG: hypothetical protein ACOC41_08510 [Chitinivibrionales bacterium]
MGVSVEEASAIIRFRLGRYTTGAQIEMVLGKIDRLAKSCV